MHTDTWKHAEAEIARRMGGVRIPINGRRGPDCDVPYFALEVKHGYQIPKRIRTWMQQAIDAAEATHDPRPPAVAMHAHGDDYSETLVAFRLKDLPLIERLIAERLAREGLREAPPVVDRGQALQLFEEVGNVLQGEVRQDQTLQAGGEGGEHGRGEDETARPTDWQGSQSSVQPVG